MVEIRYTGDELWSRIERAVEKVKDRLRRVTQALDEAGIDYAVVGGNAVQLWVAQVDETAVRNTRDVDLLMRAEDLPRAAESLSRRGFIFTKSFDVIMFLDGPQGSPRDAVHIELANKRVRPDYALAAPDLSETVMIDQTRTLPLELLVMMKLTSYRDRDRVHIRDMIALDLVNTSWLMRLPESLRPRLQELLDSPDG